jgi:hypothetical protein
LNPETCPECNRLRQEYSEVTEKRFLLEQRLKRAELRQDDEQVKAVGAMLASVADTQRRLSQALTEHVAQAHSTR